MPSIVVTSAYLYYLCGSIHSLEVHGSYRKGLDRWEVPGDLYFLSYNFDTLTIEKVILFGSGLLISKESDYRVRIW